MKKYIADIDSFATLEKIKSYSNIHSAMQRQVDLIEKLTRWNGITSKITDYATVHSIQSYFTSGSCYLPTKISDFVDCSKSYDFWSSMSSFEVIELEDSESVDYKLRLSEALNKFKKSRKNKDYLAFRAILLEYKNFLSKRADKFGKIIKYLKQALCCLFIDRRSLIRKMVRLSFKNLDDEDAYVDYLQFFKQYSLSPYTLKNEKAVNTRIHRQYTTNISHISGLIIAF